MSYRIEGKDIVISGFEEGIADSPYKGISDIRNVDLISIPKEASVAFATSNSITQASGTNIAFTANSTTDTFTYSGTPALENNMAITVSNSGGALPNGLVINTAYYIVNKTATTFQLSVDGSGNSCASGGSILNITDNGSGTNTFSIISMAQPRFFTSYVSASIVGGNISFVYFVIDTNGRIWYYYGNSQWIYMQNLPGEDQSAISRGGNGIAAWKGYLFGASVSTIQVISLFNAGALRALAYLTTKGNWSDFKTSINPSRTIFGNVPNSISHQMLVSKTDDNLYFCNINAIGTLLEVAGQTFDPATASTYTYNNTALQVPNGEVLQCIGQLQTNILVGGMSNVAYSWDRISPGYNPIFIAENGIYKIVGTNTNAFFFTGQRGRIFITNGSQADFFKKIPDHLANIPNPYYVWGDATTARNQLYFGVQATDNTGTAINQYGGVWAIDLTDSVNRPIRLVNEMSYGSYAGIVSALIPLQGSNTSDGFGLLMGWYTSSNTTAGIDKGSSTPYTGGQAYIDSDFIPIGTYLKPFTPSQLEWKVSTPLVSGESVALYYRLNLTDSYTLIPRVNTNSLVGTISDYTMANFEKAQWAQIRAVLTSTATNPSYVRLTELRIRDYPNQ